MSSKTVKYVTSDSQFHEELNNAGIRLAVVYFSGHWCGPCELLNPEFERLPKKYPRAVFIRVDVDKCFDTVAELEISVIPTFILYRNRAKIDRLRGAFLEVLEGRIKEHIGTGESEAIQELVDFERMAFKSSQSDTLKKISF
ncbi:hypothetical protein HA402_001176 [Bradysia odoriphaga]|nr:hypothetical protein HA402_001176 [Bradysia odoriphaga]